MKLFSVQQIREIENKAAELGMSHQRMMENAGSAAAGFIRKNMDIRKKRIAVLCGNGNNGGDGFVVARKLFENDGEVTVILADGLPRTETATENLIAVRERDIPIVDYAGEPGKAVLHIKTADVIVDALYGIGFHGRAEGSAGQIIETVNRLKVPVFAVDMPSGGDCNTGAVEGACIRADYTLTFIGHKTGQVIFPAAEYVGDRILCDIGLPEEAYENMDYEAILIDFETVRSYFPKRQHNTNKGDYGKALIVAGSYGMAGAAAIAARASVLSGAGLTVCALPKSIDPLVASGLYEPVYRPLAETMDGILSNYTGSMLEDELQKADACLFGPGLGRSGEIAVLLHRLIERSEKPLVIDADGINAAAENIDIWKRKKASVILTPHPGEMARLTGLTIEEVQANRLKLAGDFACEHGVTVVLKGAGTVIALPDGKRYINTTGNPGMATGGTGDMLSGMMVSFLAQGMDTEHAAVAAVYLHGLAGDMAAQRCSQHSLTPTEMLNELPGVFLKTEH
ncbi:MAG: hypothetical protein BGN88_15510 [Clostridiales bacterium 43-6]|nr:MAG: hypothetical protein BGN88_15510 [Clostridiales bacterium 43-6]